MENLLEAIEDDSGEKLEEFARNDVLFSSFEKDEISYYSSDGVEYETDLVMPSRFTDKMWHYVQPHMMGTAMKVGSNYYDVARKPDEDRIIPKPIGSAETAEVNILYRCDCYVDHNGIVRDPEVIISEKPE